MGFPPFGQPFGRAFGQGGSSSDYGAFLKNFAPGLIGIWPLTDPAGNALDISGHGLDATYNANVARGGAAWVIGNQPIASFPGNGVVNLPVAGVDALLNWEEYSVILWVKMPAAKWIDATQYNFLTFYSTGITQRIEIRKNTTLSQLVVLTDTGVSLLSSTDDTVITPDWQQIIVTQSKLANEMKLYRNGYQVSTTKTGVGTDDGSALVQAAFGAGSTVGANGIPGAAGYLSLYAGTILTAQQAFNSYAYAASRYASPAISIIGSGDSTWDSENVTTSKLITNLGTSYGFSKEISLSGLTSTTWKNGTAGWLGIDAELAAKTLYPSPSFVITGIGKNDMSAMPSQATFEANIAYVYDAIHAKWPNAKIVVEIPWRVGQDTNANLLKGYFANVMATRPWTSIGTDETGYFRTAENATPGSYSSDGTHINTAAGTTDRAARLAAAIAAL